MPGSTHFTGLCKSVYPWGQSIKDTRCHIRFSGGPSVLGSAETRHTHCFATSKILQDTTGMKCPLGTCAYKKLDTSGVRCIQLVMW